MAAYSCRLCGMTANITVTPDRVSVWYLRPLDSNSITCACAHPTHSTRANPHTASQRAIDSILRWRLVLRCSFHAVDHQNLCRRSARFEFEPKLRCDACGECRIGNRLLRTAFGVDEALRIAIHHL